MAFAIAAALLDAASTGFQLLFDRGWENSRIVYEPFCTPIDSKGSSEVYHVPDAIGPMREWIGDRIIENLGRQTLELKNLTFEKTVGVRVEDFEDDRLGGYDVQFTMLGAQARLHPDELWVTALEGGFSKTGYDGVSFYSTSHPTDKAGTTWSNKGTAALDSDAFEDGVKTMRKVKNSAGQNVDPLSFGGELHLVVPPALESTALRIVGAKTVSTGGDNVNYNRAKVVVNPRLTSDIAWYLAVGNGPARPFIVQTRRKPKLTMITAPDSEDVFHKNRILYGVDGRWNVGRALPQFIYASTGAS